MLLLLTVALTSHWNALSRYNGEPQGESHFLEYSNYTNSRDHGMAVAVQDLASGTILAFRGWSNVIETLKQPR